MEEKDFVKIAEMVEKIGNAFVGLQEMLDQFEESVAEVINPEWFDVKGWIKDMQKELNEIEDGWSFLAKIPEIEEHMEK